jgi:hypothetical protein
MTLEHRVAVLTVAGLVTFVVAFDNADPGGGHGDVSALIEMYCWEHGIKLAWNSAHPGEVVDVIDVRPWQTERSRIAVWNEILP